MRSIIAAVVLAVPFVAGCVDEVDVGSQASEVQASLVDEHFELVQDGSPASLATAMVEVPIRDASGAQKMVPSNAGPPFPPSYPVRGTCGVTFIAPHYAVTAAHCVSGTNVPQPTSISLAVHSYDITAVAETWQLLFTGIVSGNFPNYEPLAGGPSADEIPGYQSQTTFCSVRARCSSAFGPKHNCSSFDADIALLHCPTRSSDAPWLRVAASDPQTGPVEMYWFHEVLYMPIDSSSSPERFTHYTQLTSQESNFHYLDSRTNAILPLKSVPWPDGTARRRTGPAPGGTGTDLFGCHGTSGSGVLQRNAQDQLELLGPVAQGNVSWQQTRLCTDPDPSRHQPGVFNISYTTNASTRQLETAFLPELATDRGEGPVPDRFAYAWANSPTTASYTPHAAYAYNSTGGAIQIDRQSAGIYNVTFAGLRGWGPGLSSAVAVTAYGSTSISCSSLTYSSSPTTTAVLVGCFDAATGAMADSRFTIMVVGNQSVPTPSAFVMSGGPAPVPPPNPAWSWTSGNQPITVTHLADVGEYDVLLGTGNTPRSAKLVTAGSGGGSRCNNLTGISGGLRVRCYDWTGAATNQGFSVVQIAGGRPGKRVGFAVANLPTTASYTPATNSSFNSSGGAITATRSAVGRYAMNFAGLQKLGSATEHVQVAAISNLLATCNVVHWGNSADGLLASIECRNGSGQLVDTRYDVLVIE
jgi:hypothetical protein